MERCFGNDRQVGAKKRCRNPRIIKEGKVLIVLIASGLNRSGRVAEKWHASSIR
jgi:hypothetical protein